MATTTVHQARAALGKRLRDLRRDASLTGRELAGLAGWQSSKVSKIEYGKQPPSEEDIRVWCRLCNAVGALRRTVESVHRLRRASRAG